MSSKEVAVAVRGLSKSYSIAHNNTKHTTLGEALVHRARNPFQTQEKETFWALKDMSFDIKKGDVVGIIGRNGAGKSTLLKILSQITEPTCGEVRLYGRVGSLLEVGTGFHPELTGRENIYLNGAILGMRRSEIERQFDEIVDFAEVAQFLDTPVKRYSSGMYVRLAFAVAAHLNPEILVVDEVLAVGDAQFQKKCLGKMGQVANEGRTVLFVSHNSAVINVLCKTCLLLRSGTVESYGPTSEVLSQYASAAHQTSNQLIKDRTDRSGTGSMKCTRILLRDKQMNETPFMSGREAFFIEIEYESYAQHKTVMVSIDVETIEGVRITTLYSGFMNEIFEVEEGEGKFLCCVEGLYLRPDTYYLNVMLGNEQEQYDFVRNAASFKLEEDHAYPTGRVPDKAHGPLMARFSWSVADR
jgi:lipopolysaccharide transport system ATP-binding protein